MMSLSVLVPFAWLNNKNRVRELVRKIVSLPQNHLRFVLIKQDAALICRVVMSKVPVIPTKVFMTSATFIQRIMANEHSLM